MIMHGVIFLKFRTRFRICHSHYLGSAKMERIMEPRNLLFLEILPGKWYFRNHKSCFLSLSYLKIYSVSHLIFLSDIDFEVNDFLDIEFEIIENMHIFNQIWSFSAFFDFFWSSSVFLSSFKCHGMVIQWHAEKGGQGRPLQYLECLGGPSTQGRLAGFHR